MCWGFMPEIAEVQDILRVLGMPPAQHNEMSALTLLALCNLKSEDRFASAQRRSMTVSKGIMAFIHQHYGKAYAPNTRETFRRQVLHQFVQSGIADYNPDDPFLPTNSPKAHYAISENALALIRLYGTRRWKKALQDFQEKHAAPVSRFGASRETANIAFVLAEGTVLALSPGSHNQLQVDVLQKFVPNFASGATLLYLGDTADKDLYVARNKLAELNISVTAHDKLPDIVLYLPDRNWLYLIEAVTSHGPMTPKRIIELGAWLEKSPVGKIYVTAFLTFAEFRKHMRDIAWETEVWVAETPEHLIHFNGDRFLGPR